MFGLFIQSIFLRVYMNISASELVGYLIHVSNVHLVSTSQIIFN
jgi:hypothetical protein